MLETGGIFLHRKIIDWEWYKDVNTFKVFIHCLLNANFKEGRFMGTVVPRGSFITSMRQLAKKVGISEREVRTAIKHLKMTREITQQTTHNWSLITVVKYDFYQEGFKKNDTANDTVKDTQTTQWRHSGDNNINNNNKENKSNNISSYKFDVPSEEEVEKFFADCNFVISSKAFYDYQTRNGWSVYGKPLKDWKAVALTWNTKELAKQKAMPEKKSKFANYDEVKIDYENFDENNLNKLLEKYGG